jgi:hypothetical protein
VFITADDNNWTISFGSKPCLCTVIWGIYVRREYYESVGFLLFSSVDTSREEVTDIFSQAFLLVAAQTQPHG